MLQGRYDETTKKFHELYQKIARAIVTKEKKLIHQAVTSPDLKQEIAELRAYQQWGIQSSLAILEVDQQQEVFG